MVVAKRRAENCNPTLDSRESKFLHHQQLHAVQPERNCKNKLVGTFTTAQLLMGINQRERVYCVTAELSLLTEPASVCQKYYRKPNNLATISNLVAVFRPPGCVHASPWKVVLCSAMKLEINRIMNFHVS